MTLRIRPFIALAWLLAVGLLVAPNLAAAQTAPPLSLSSATVSIAGTSNVHDFTASTKNVRVTRLEVAGGVHGSALPGTPGALEVFEIAVSAASLASDKDGLDKNMHKALKVTEFPEIVFRLTKLAGIGPALKALGVLKIAGVEKSVTFDLKTVANGTTLTVTGQVPLVMTDYGITPPKAMMGMLKTDPKITVKFETVFAVPTTF